uniref:Uncharacterized protein n=1 Tax=Globisporangium ultimum (strain ATCC 200006 / CBS 805.95 / DAOM BR144) TaxID=431595 RepID=K3WEA3_GLOUD
MEPLKPLGSPKVTHTTPSTVPVLSPLAAFTKQQRDHAEGSQSNDGGKVSVLASFAKSHHQQQSTVLYDDLLSPSSVATSASRPTLKRLDSTDKPTGSLTPLSLPSLPVSKKPDKQNAKHALATEKTDAKQDAAHGNEKPQDKDTEEKAESRLPDEAKDTEVSGTDEGHAAEENASSTSEDFQVMDSDDENELNERGDNEPEDAKATFDVPTAEADLYTSISEEQGTAHLT